MFWDASKKNSWIQGRSKLEGQHQPNSGQGIPKWSILHCPHELMVGKHSAEFTVEVGVSSFKMSEFEMSWVAMTPKDWLHFLNLYLQKHLTGLTVMCCKSPVQNLGTPRNRMAKSQSTPRQSTLAMNFWWSPLFRTWMTAAWRITCALVSNHRLPQVASLSNEFWLFIPLTNWKEVFHCFNGHNTSFCDEDLKL